MKQIQFGFCEWYLPFNGPSSLQFCAEMGYDGIQLSDLGGPGQNFPMTEPHLVHAYIEQSKQTGVELQCFNLLSVVYNGCLKAPPNTEMGRIALLTMQKGFEACSLLGVREAFISSALRSQISSQQELEYTVQNLIKGKKFADDLGITFLYESFSPVAVTKEICARTEMKLMYDTLNPLKYGFGESAPAEISEYGTDLIHTIHFKDWDPLISSDVPMGDGIGMVPECVKALKKIGYRGWIINEGTYFKSHLVKNGGNPWDIASSDLKTLRTLFQQE